MDEGGDVQLADSDVGHKEEGVAKVAIGVLGIGHLAGYLLRGFLRSGLAPDQLLLSPGGRAAEAAAKHGLAVAADNAELVARSDAVLLCVRPPQAEKALAGLPWRAGQLVVSACAGVPLSLLGPAAAPAEVVRAMPISAAAIGASPTTLFPERHDARALLERLGPVIALDAEEDFTLATAEMAVYGWVHALIATTADWAQDEGLPPSKARRIAAATFEAAARMVMAEERPVGEMVAALATPGGLTEAGLEGLRSRDVEAAWAEACRLALKKMTG